MKNKLWTILWVSFFLVGLSGTAFASLIHTAIDGSTGIKYEFYEDVINWDAANTAATSLVGGMLAVVDSVTENTFVANELATSASQLYNGQGVGPWLGGYNTSGTWQWVDGSTWSYAPWQGGQPDTFEGLPQGLVYYNGGATSGLNWGDYGQFSGDPGGGAGPILGYIVEYDPIPEPATMLLLGTGLIGVAGAARRKKKNQA